jgi:cyclopropane-fatty-acyl-phospholipid synthase
VVPESKNAMSIAIDLAERGWLPDFAIRSGVRRMLKQALVRLEADPNQEALVEQLRGGPIAIETDAANRQHYEVPAPFFALMLGPWRKYSCCYWPAGVETIGQAEVAMLELSAQRAELADGQQVLDFGCGWGAFTLWAAGRFPNSTFTALSNSHSQRESIDAQARKLGLRNVTVITANATEIDPVEFQSRFDRIVTIEMLEHTRNTERLFKRFASWLRGSGRLFVHVFSHRRFAYPFDAASGDWMSTHFFSGGMMPSHDLYTLFQTDLKLETRWLLSGTHYARTLRAWLEQLDANRAEALALLKQTRSDVPPEVLLQRWRLFLIGCEESFAFKQGSEWGVSHYRFQPPEPS